VAVAIPRSVELVVALYAVVKSGAAFVPVDPDHPAARIAHVLDLARPILTLTGVGVRANLPDGLVCACVEDIECGDYAADPVADGERRAPLRPDHPAYVLFTSGSTGAPKGVALTHAATVHQLAWAQQQYPHDRSDSVLHKTPITFDIAVWELFWPLQVGAAIVVAAPDGHRDPAYLAQLIADYGITTAHFVPSMLDVLLELPTTVRLSSVRHLFAAGEALATHTATRAAELFDKAQVVNWYGPAEAEVVTAYRCAAQSPSGTVPIGAPVAGMTVHVLNSRLRPVPAGSVGDLYVAGAQLARGYHGRPDLTAAAFVANPLGAPGDRLYRTGDLARWTPAGELEYVGRGDFQVKLRGQRVEPGDVEAALRTIDSVARAVAVVAAERIVAYVTAVAGAQLDGRAVREQVARLLPGYLVPATVQVLDALPLNANGKLDRAALPAPVYDDGDEFVAPRTDREAVLAKMVAEVVGCEHVGVTADLFAIGVNSLSAAQIAARAEAVLGVRVGIRDIFDAPTVAGLAERVAMRDRYAAVPLVRRTRPAAIPLAAAQRRMWFLNQFDPESGAYNIGFAARLTGPLDAAALRAAFLDVLDRHEPLRTMYPSVDGQPRQVVEPVSAVSTAAPEVEPVADAELADRIRAVVEEGFDVAECAPVRARLFGLGDREHVLVLAVHHIAADGASVAPLARDVFAAYQARCAGRRPDWDPLPVGYADYALWQRQLLGSEDNPDSLAGRQIAYWRRVLDGAPELLGLPVDFPRPVTMSTAGGTSRFDIPAELHDQVVQFALREGATVFMVLHAALAILLARTAHSDDICVGTPVAGRGPRELDDLVGMFVNTVVLRCRVDEDLPFREFVARLRDVDLEALAHTDVPYERLVDVLERPRSGAYTPLYQVMFALQNTPEAKFELSGLAVDVLDPTVAQAKTDLTLLATERRDGDRNAGIAGEIVYATDLFTAATAAAFGERFVRVLAATVAAPTRPVREIDLLAVEETRALLPAGGPALVAPCTLPDLLGRAVALDPAAVALIGVTETVSYGELDSRSNRLAARLRAHGVGPGDFVALALPRSVAYHVAMWAVAKTGAAFVALDLRAPVERIAYLVADAAIGLGLTVTEARTSLPDSVRWLCLDDERVAADVAAHPAGPMRDAQRTRRLRLDDAAYLLYTSGSTGRPKGVVVTHAGLAGFTDAEGRRYRVRPTSRVLQVAAPAFDAVLSEALMAYAVGAALVVAPAQVYAGEELSDLIRAQRVSHAFLTPSVLSTLSPSSMESVRVLAVGGEVVSPDLVAQWAPGRRFHNIYGPTETTVAVTTSSPLRPGDVPRIGTLFEGVGAVVLDRRMRPVPIGVAGELYLAGAHLARGYLNRTGQTAAAFVANPYSGPGLRMYRTGDLVRWSAAAELEYLGRADFQVKIRGQRIELGEIDAATLTCPGVAAAVTVARRGAGGQPTLATYVVPEPGDSVEQAQLLAHLAVRLPEHMVPATVTVLDRIPLSPTGKVDRGALPEPVFDAPGCGDAVATELEAVIARVFAEVLALPEVGVTSSFFALGGDSIMSIQLAARLKSAGVLVTARDIFERKTVRGLAGVAGSAGRDSLAELPGGGVGDIPFTPVLAWYVERLGAPRGFAQSILVGLPGDARLDDVVATVRAVIERHDILRARLRADHLEVTAPDPAAAGHAVLVREFDAEHAPGRAGFAESAESALAEAVSQLDPASGELIRVVWLRPEAGVPAEARALIVIHHLAVDGVSWRILLPDFVAAWHQVVAGEPVALPAPGTSMRRWAHALPEAAAGRTGELPLWQRIGAGPDPLLGRAALDRRLDTQSTVAQLSLSVPAVTTTALVDVVPKAVRGTVDDALLAGLAVAVFRWRRRRGIDHPSVRILLESHGREEQLAAGADLSRTVGWFTSLCPVALDLTGVDTDDPRAAVKAVKATLRALPDKGIGYGLLRYGSDAAALGALPEPQISFNYLGRAGVDLAALSGVAWVPVADEFDRTAALEPTMPAAAALTIDSSVVDTPAGPTLSVRVGYASRLFDHAEVADLVGEWTAALAEIAEAARDASDWGLSCADTPLVDLTQRDLDELARRHGPITDVWPLSPLQAGLLFHAELAAGELDVYTAQAALTLTGVVDEQRMRSSAAALLRRHPNVRAAFARSRGGAAVSVVPAEVRVPWQRVEVGDATELAQLLAAQRHRPFDPAEPPLLRFVFAVVGPAEYRLVLTAHHLLLDGWSLPLLLRELIALYAAGADTLPAAPSYLGYLEWLAALDAARAGRMWQEALREHTVPTLVADRAADRPVDVPIDLAIDLDPAVAAALTEFARSQSVTMSTVVQFAWATVLANLLGRREIVFGETVSGRPADLPGVESMIGLFINTLPVPVTVSPDRTIAESLRLLQADKTRLLDCHQVSLSDIMAAAGVGQLFDTLVVFESYPVDATGMGDADIDGMRVTAAEGSDAAHYPITVQAHQTDTVHLRLRYQRACVADGTAAALADRLHAVLRQIAADPGVRLDRIDLLSQAERRALVPARGRAQARSRTLAALLAGAASRWPERPAVLCGETTLSFGALDEWSNRLARLLAHHRVGSEDVVALVMPRSSHLLASVWAVAKTGAAFALLDPRNPRERIAGMAADCGARLVVTTTAARDTVPDGDWSTLVVDDETVAAAVAARSGAPLTTAQRPLPVRADNLAYIIYTSGTTGTPKGVAVTHAGLANFAAEQHERYRVDPESRVLQAAAPGFDAVMLEILLAHPHGAALVVAAPDLFAGLELAELIRAQRVTHAFLTPTVLATMSPEELDGFAVLVSGGEALRPDLARTWSPGRRLFNGYGPTETTIMVAISDPVSAGEPIVIGGPIRGTSALVLDARLRPVPTGVTGELYLSGVQLARGYVGRPADTAAAFVAYPGDPGVRMYRTGDLVRWRAERTLEYLGRADHQVKIRGQRVELGEIEAVLARHPAVVRAVVLPRRDEQGVERLVGYLVGDGVDPHEVRADARLRLPAHLLPDICVAVAELPRTVTGKLDRAALPVPQFLPAAEYVAPRTDGERTVAEIYAEVLGVARVGAEDNFFNLGGNSLTATKVAARLGAAQGARVGVRSVFEAPVVADLAARLARGGDTARPVRTIPPRPEAVPLSPAQQRMWFLNQLAISAGAYNIPLVIRLRGDLDADALRQACALVIDRHESLRTAFPAVDGVPRQVVLAASEVAPQLLPVRIDEAGLFAAVAAVVGAPFDVTATPPIRAELFTLGDDEHVLVIAVHHICADGLSMIPLARDVAAAYQAAGAGVEPDWPPLAIQYPDYALWRRAELGDETDPDSMVSEQLGYWRQTLAGQPELLELPTDSPRPPVASMRGRALPFEVSAQLRERIEGLARQTNTTVFMVLHAALAVLLGRLARTDDVAVGTPVSGRGEAELDDLIGMFVNTVVLRTRISISDPFAAVLAAARETDLAALAHAEVPFEQVVEALNPPRSTAHLPLYQVTIDYQNLTGAALDLPGVAVAPVEEFAEVAHADLNVKLTEALDADGRPAGILGRLTYASDLFGELSMRRFAHRYLTVLEAVTADPRIIVGDIEILDRGEHGELIRAAGGPGVSLRGATLDELFAAVVAAQPDAIAVGDRASGLSYAELNRRARLLAGRLAEHGVGPESLVAVALPRSTDLVVAILAVVLAGAGYLPVDTAYPPERVDFMLADARPRALLTSTETAPMFGGFRGATVLVDQIADDTGGVDAAPPAARPDNVAYVIYTSGSTGRPKGVVVSHRDLATLLANAAERFDFGPDDVWTMFHSYAFDFAVWEIWGALLSGGRVVVIDADTTHDPRALVQTVAAQGVTVLSQTPSAFYGFAEAEREYRDAGCAAGELALRYIVFGGEALDASRLADWFARRRGAAPKLVNMYGITETTVHVTSRPVVAAGPAGIGTALPGMRTYVLDDRLRPVPVGVPAEIYVAGGQLARGYLGAPALTAGRFVANPFGAKGSRLYRTGDLGRWRRSDAGLELDYLGRVDSQVQLRGFRIELGEVESALLRHPDVAQAAAAVCGPDRDAARLVGYVVAAHGKSVDPAQVRQTAARFLTGYMAPSAVVVLPALPVTVNGKLDRAALPTPDFDAAADAWVAPRTRTEALVAEVFAGVLGVRRVGAFDGFFDLGGNSLLATNAVMQLRARGVRIELPWMFDDATPAALACRADEVDPDSGMTVLLPLRGGGARPGLFAIHPAGGLAWFYGGLVGHLHQERPMYGLQDPHVVAARPSAVSIDELAEHYVREIRAAQPAGPYHLLGWSLGGEIAHAVATRLQRGGGAVGMLAMMDCVAGRAESVTDATAGARPGELMADLLGGWRELFEFDDAVQAGTVEQAWAVIREQITRTGLFAAEQVDRVMESFENAAALSADHRPGVFEGDLVFFTAGKDRADHAAIADTWRPHVTGSIHNTVVDARHLELTHSVALAVIGPILERFMNE
jgi:amino acid adenylation domain-containing protein/non-ribosomal peptide synthase protein (TIGR01720 family)